MAAILLPTGMAAADEPQTGATDLPAISSFDDHPAPGTVMPNFDLQSVSTHDEATLAASPATAVTIDEIDTDVAAGDLFDVDATASDATPGTQADLWIRISDGNVYNAGQTTVGQDGSIAANLRIMQEGVQDVQVSVGEAPSISWSTPIPVNVREPREGTQGAVVYRTTDGTPLVQAYTNYRPIEGHTDPVFHVITSHDQTVDVTPQATAGWRLMASFTLDDQFGALQQLPAGSSVQFSFTTTAPPPPAPAPGNPGVYLTGTTNRGDGITMAWRAPGDDTVSYRVLSTSGDLLGEYPAGARSATVAVPGGAYNPGNVHVKLQAVAADGQVSSGVDVWGGPTTTNVAAPTAVEISSPRPGSVQVGYGSVPGTGDLIRVDVCNDNGDCRVEWLKANSGNPWVFDGYDPGHYTVGVRTVWNSPWQFSDMTISEVTVG